ncbi:MAG TPA: hypothetical protein VLC10_01895 [Patescibacteria group bacterium]|nr:hypothetical protein [Patescibacteria group bacterium]
MRKVVVFKVAGPMIALCRILAFFAGCLLGLGFLAWISGIAPTDGTHLMSNGVFVALCAIAPLLPGIRLMPEAEARRLTSGS